MRRNDEAVSELLGYTVLVSVVAFAAIGLLAGGMGALSTTEKRMEYSGSISAMTSFGNILSDSIEANNTYGTAYEMSVPQGYDLIVKDRHDDFRSLSVYSDSERLACLSTGSVTMRSPFRTVAFEGGAVISNDTGLVKAEIGPAFHVVTLPSGKKALYMSVASITGDSFARHAGHATLYVKCSSVRPMSWHIQEGGAVTIRVRSGDPLAWKERFEACGFATGFADGAISATSREVSAIYVAYAEADVRAD